MNDRGYEKLAIAIKKMVNMKPNIYVGVMTSSNSCKVNDLVLDKDDLLFAEHLTTGYVRTNADTYTSVSSLQTGDTVLVCKINADKYSVIERLVEV